MSKVVSKAKRNGLKENLSQYDKKIVVEKKESKPSQKEYARSYRLDSEIRDILITTLNRINEISPKRVSETRLVKALIFLSKEIDENKIIKALKEVW